MRITLLNKNPFIYTGNAYLIRGDKNSLDDVNTLIDTGSDFYIQDEINSIYTGAGKRAIEQVLITHNHFDHSGGLNLLVKKYAPKVYAYSHGDFITNLLQDNDQIKVGNNMFQVIHTPGHSNDSLCYYNHDEQVLFSGDSPIDIKTTDGTYTEEFIKALERLASLKIKIIYPGHGNPIRENANTIIKNSLELAIKSKIISS